MKETFVIKVEVEWEDFKTKALNEKAKRDVKNYLLETLNSEASFISMYVEKDESGAAIESCSKQTKIKVV